MNDAMFRPELHYQASLSIAKNLLDNGLLTQEEYECVEQRLLAHYQPVTGYLLCSTDTLGGIVHD